MSDAAKRDADSPWWKGVTRYQWLVLTIASLGWVFDIFEGQIFVTSMNEMMGSLLSESTTPDERDAIGKIALGAFLSARDDTTAMPAETEGAREDT